MNKIVLAVAEITGNNQDAIDDLVQTLQGYPYTDYVQEPTCGIVRMNEQQFDLVKGQLIGCWTQVKGLAANMRALEELLLL